MKLDLAVVNGTAFVDGCFRKCDIGISGGKIAAVCEPGLLPEAAQMIDAGGHYILPGVVDSHVHIRDPGHAERENFFTGTRAAAAGGTCTIVEMPTSMPPQYKKEILDNRIRIADEQACCDFAMYGAAGGEFPEEITKLAKEGIVAFKTFLQAPAPNRIQEYVGLTTLDNGAMMRVMTEVAKTKCRLFCHAESDPMIQENIRRLRAMGRVDPMAHCESRPPITEYSVIESLITMAKATGAKLGLVHVSTVEGMEMIKKAKYEGMDILAETCPQYLLMDETLMEKVGVYAKCNPPLRKREIVEKLWDYVNDGTVDFIGSDHSPYCFHEKDPGLTDIFAAPPGFPGMDHHVPLLLDAALRGKMTLEKLVEMTSIGPARCFNLFPQKGNIAAGADGDLTIVDPNGKTLLEKQKSYSLARELYLLHDNEGLRGSVEYTVVRGKIVMDHGVVEESMRGWGKVVLATTRE